MYRMVCMACHDFDGKGSFARKAMPVIPDFTDVKWQASRSDAELQHSILEGKGQLMLRMKEKLDLIHVEPKDMVAFVRSFRDGKHVVLAQPAGLPVAGGPIPAEVAAALAGTAAPAPVAPAGPGQPVAIEPSPAAVSTAAGAPLPGSTPPSPVSTALAPTTGSAKPPLATPPRDAAGAVRLQAGAGPATELPAAIPATLGPSPDQAVKIRAASDYFRLNCIACHGLDGRGTLVRLAMPTLPDFTNHQWQVGRSNTQLQASVLDGKGTLMPAWNGKVTRELAKDLVAYVRTIGAPELLASTGAAVAQNTEFEKRLRELKGQRDEVERQLRELDRPSTIR
jgi:mono/diheme cytochrome c family protein